MAVRIEHELRGVAGLICDLDWIPAFADEQRAEGVVKMWATGTSYVTALRYATYGIPQATASGRLHLNNCRPDCAQGTFHSYAGRITLKGIVRCNDRTLLLRTDLLAIHTLPSVTCRIGNREHRPRLGLLRIALNCVTCPTRAAKPQPFCRPLLGWSVLRDCVGPNEISQHARHPNYACGDASLPWVETAVSSVAPVRAS